MITFFTMAMVMGYGMGSIDGFLFIFLDELGARLSPRLTQRCAHDVMTRVEHAGHDQLWNAAGGSELLMGLTVLTTCIAEVPIMHMTGRLLEAVGVKIMLHGVLAVYILRLLYYSILQHLARPFSLAAVCKHLKCRI